MCRKSLKILESIQLQNCLDTNLWARIDFRQISHLLNLIQMPRQKYSNPRIRKQGGKKSYGNETSLNQHLRERTETRNTIFGNNCRD